MSLKLRFTLAMTTALAVVMGIAGYLLSHGVTNEASSAIAQRIGESVALTAKEGQVGNYEQEGSRAVIIPGTNVKRFPVRYGLIEGRDEQAELYEGHGGDDQDRVVHLLVPEDSGRAGSGLRDLILGIMALVIAVGAVVSFVVAHSVATPIEGLVDDVRQIAGGNLMKRTHVRIGGEVRALAREIDKMASSLKDAQEQQLASVAREREMEVAEEVREALLPEGTPDIPGYDLEALQIGCPTPGGDFYDVFEYEDGRFGLLVCEISGDGIPGALIGATARAYLSSVLPRSEDMVEGIQLINRYLAKGVRRGMYATALYVVIQPTTGEAEVACAGHKVPLLHFVSEGKVLKPVQPEGIALGFDRGPIFDRTLKSGKVHLAAGDRLLLSNTGPLQVHDEQSSELGEKSFYRLAMKRAFGPSGELLESIDSALDSFAGEEDFPHDISILTIRRSPA